MIERINDARDRAGLKRLKPAPSLVSSSSRQATWMLNSGCMCHRSLGSSRFGRVGEALAYHRGRALRVGGTVAAWRGSASHRAVLFGRFRYIGAASKYGGGKTVWVVQVGG